MKTTEELYKKFAGIWTPEELFLMDYGNFMQALTEHDNETKDLIDDMIERKKWLISNEPRPDGDFKAVEKQIEINILTELKNKLGL